MIIDLNRFIENSRTYWTRLETMLDNMENDTTARLNLEQIKELHYLYQRSCADLARVATFSSEPEVRQYLESLVARAYAEIHETRGMNRNRFSFTDWFLNTFPRTFRKHIRAFWVSVAVTMVGLIFGAAALSLDPEAKSALIGFEHLKGSPSDRVQQEESAAADRLSGQKSHFSAFLMTHNIRVSIFAVGLGMSWGLGTIVVLFYNGVILGAVCADYVLAGESAFLAGWLLPHGVVEIPAFLIAGQTGLILANAFIGWGARVPISERFRHIAPDLVTMLGGLAVLLVWAGIIEAFFSQYHEPALPYSVKISFGVIEFGILIFYLLRSGKAQEVSE